jgi:uncharacterized membrane protein
MAEEKTEAAARSAGSQSGGSDAEKNKAIACLAYLIFFLPYLAAKDSKFAMYHANQGLLLLLLSVAVNILGSVVPVIGWFLILPLGWIFWLILLIMGITNASKGEMKPLPLIGGVKIIS